MIIRKADRPFRAFSTYDFEWVPGSLEIRLCGCYNGRTYVRYNSIVEFLDGQLSRANKGRWFFAHFGGLADFQFVLEELFKRPQYSVECIFSGSSVIIAKVRHKQSRETWTFLDSAWLFKVPLKEIGKWIGIEKGGPEEGMTEEQKKEWFASVPLDELEIYNDGDCRILWHAIAQFELELLELGGQLRMTLASCSLDLFLRKYLKQEILVNDVVNRQARGAYIASRVEVLHKKPKAYRSYDINSSFPYSMTFPLPGNVKTICTGRPDSGLYLCEAEIEVPEAHIPPLPYRHKGKIYFPHGKWRSYFFSIDLETLEANGGKVLRTWESVIFEPFTDCEAFARDLYARRGTAEGFRKEIFKLLLNSLYGKFAENPEKQTVYVHPSLETMENLDLVTCPGNPPVGRAKMFMPGVFVETKERKLDHSHVAISGAITAYSRRWLGEYMVRANDCYYVDTDSVAVDPDTTFPTGKNLGDLKLEKTCLETPGDFLRPKVYRMTDDDGTVYCKAKGFSLKTKKGKAGPEAIKQFEELMAGRNLSINRMARIRENLSNGIIHPWESLVTKRLTDNETPKRHFHNDGSSDPLSTDEIIALDT